MMKQIDKSKMWDHSIGQKDWTLKKKKKDILKNMYIFIFLKMDDCYRLKEIKNSETAKTGLAQWIERRPAE